ncbi:dihydroxyacetone kinase subunit DhaK [Agarivorans sp. TSD2052]|uniref:dihydroxyacetone kinase subunit DhaK n=1 Tax=Agarivorans sp. TSD2052 TaxID=2937286 RepID=UPI00200C79D5|nr:dihydroxyacetone kinase subunit DhaK [Agarivorans sp. TSD2052]UPW18070.1 dihydroxyacetone kinase subunit DhaK [Agarivorans sp. TSD2052]
MSQLIVNSKESWVADSIDGSLYTSKYNNISKIEFGDGSNIVARNDWDKSKVAIICGGGSGHEPAHAGFVGKGMLTAAVCGNIFAAPNVDAVLNAIVHVTGDAGCLVVIKNYTGDRLNFGLACERAKDMGLKVDMVIVNDDISIPSNPQPRGIAGTLFVNKLAGFLSEKGESLESIKENVQKAIKDTHSIGVAITSCNLPEQTSDKSILPGTAELGLGIHGESGIEVIQNIKSKLLVQVMIQKLLLAQEDSQAPLAVIINNLGGLSPIEMNVVAKDIFESELSNRIKLVVGPDTLMTAIDMKGFSISILALDEVRHEALIAETQTQAWSGAREPHSRSVLNSVNHAKKTQYEPSENDHVKGILLRVCNKIVGMEESLNNLDAIVGDGDTGSTFAAGAKSILRRIDLNDLPLNDTALLLMVIGEKLSKSMGGSSGVLLSIFFTTASRHYSIRNCLVSAFQAGLATMMEYGGAKVGDRTMIDALYPALEAWKEKGFSAAVLAAANGAEGTVDMTKAKAGRSSYLSTASLIGTKDPGSYAIEMMFKSVID